MLVLNFSVTKLVIVVKDLNKANSILVIKINPETKLLSWAATCTQIRSEALLCLQETRGSLSPRSLPGQSAGLPGCQPAASPQDPTGQVSCLRADVLSTVRSPFSSCFQSQHNKDSCKLSSAELDNVRRKGIGRHGLQL